MHSDLLDTLNTLPTDPARVVDLYRQLYAASLMVLVQAGSVSETDLKTALFLTYPSHDGVRELPVFTSRDYLFENIHPDAVFVTANGNALWPRLLGLMRDWQLKPEQANLAVAVDPGQAHGIRLGENMILGMIRGHGG